jgi:hypothetical protein
MKAKKHLTTGWMRILLLIFLQVASSYSVYAQNELPCTELNQITLVNAIPNLTSDGESLLTFQNGIPVGIATPAALGLYAPVDVPQYAKYDIGGGIKIPVTIFTWRISSKSLLNGRGFNNFFVEASKDCQGFNKNYILQLLAFKGPQPNDIKSWNTDDKGNSFRFVDAANNSNCTSTGAIIEWQSISNTNDGYSYCIAILYGKYNASTTSKAYVRTGSDCCFYRAPQGGYTYGIQCDPEPLCTTPIDANASVAAVCAGVSSTTGVVNNPQSATDAQISYKWSYDADENSLIPVTNKGVNATINLSSVVGGKVYVRAIRTINLPNATNPIICPGDQIEVVVTVNPLPKVNVDNGNVCAGSAIDLNTLVQSATGGSWTKLTGSGSLSGDTYTAGPSAGTATLRYTYQNDNSCQNSDDATITIIATNTVGSASSSETLCINTALTAITHSTTGATGIGTATGLPAGVTAAWSGDVITISGTPTASGTFNYSIPLTGGCGSVSATGTIVVTPDNTVGSASSSETLCINTALTAITHSTTGATGIGTATGLPAGVTAAWSGDVITISGTPTASGTFNYSIPLTGGCGSVSATGTITVNVLPTVSIDPVEAVCYGAEIQMNAKPSNTGKGVVWSVQGGISFGTISPSGLYKAPVEHEGAVVIYTYTDGNGCTSQDEEAIEFSNCSLFCTYSQGYYGNPGGKSCHVVPESEAGSVQETTIQRIRRAFNNYAATQTGAKKDVVKFGKDNRSFNLRRGDIFATDPTYTGYKGASYESKQGLAERIFALLPGGGSAMVITADGPSVDGGWNSQTGINNSSVLRTLPNNPGKINNSLLAQTVAMWINVWSDDHNLKNWKLPEGGFDTYNSNGCVEIISQSGDPIHTDVPPAFAGRSVLQLLEDANEALAGYTISRNGQTITPSLVHGMLGKLVDAFHGCKSLAGFAEFASGARSEGITFGGPVISTTSEVTVKEEPKSDVVVKAFPNPYVDQVTFNITVKNAGKGSLVIYNAIGQKVANVFEGDMQANSTQTIRYSVPVSQRKSLVYVFRQNGNTNTGRLVSGK